MLSVILLSFATIAALFRGLWDRAKVGVIALVPAVAHYSFLNDVNAHAYYLSAAVTSFIVIVILELLPRSPLVLDFMKINVAYIFIHASGYVMWYSYMEPTIYNYACYALFIVEFVRLLTVTKLDAKHGICRNSCAIRSNDNNRHMGTV